MNQNISPSSSLIKGHNMLEYVSLSYIINSRRSQAVPMYC